jgi:hypothetical protein
MLRPAQKARYGDITLRVRGSIQTAAAAAAVWPATRALRV